MNLPFTHAPGFRIRYETHGDGFPLLLVNGLGGDHVEWGDQLPAFSRAFRVIVFDNRGAGDSDTPPGPYGTEGMADDAAALLGALGIRRAHVLGVSLGGMIAQQAAIRHPERVAGLVLACTSPGGPLSLRPDAEAIAAFMRRPDEDREAGIRRSLPYLYSDRALAERPGAVEAFVRRRLLRPYSPEGYASQLAAAIGHEAGERLGEIRSPTLVITGERDRLVPPENSRRISERIPGARLVVVPGAGHRIFADAPEAFNREVLAFLSGTEGKPRD